MKLYDQNNADKIIICGGILQTDKHPISELMKSFLIEIGVNDSIIFTEKKSQNTHENLLNVLPILESSGYTAFISLLKGQNCTDGGRCFVLTS